MNKNNLTLALMIGAGALLVYLYLKGQATNSGVGSSIITTGNPSTPDQSLLQQGMGVASDWLKQASDGISAMVVDLPSVNISSLTGFGSMSQESIDALASGTYGVPGL
jgi:hypothetical protein